MGLTHSDPQIVNALYDNDKIQDRVFSFYINNSTQSSFIDIGALKSSNIKGGTNALRYIEANPVDYFWSGFNQGVSFGATPNATNSFKYGSFADFTSDVLEDESAYTIFDTSLPYIAIANQHFDSFLAKLFEQVGGYDYNITDGVDVLTNGILMTRCSYEFPTIQFLFNDVWLQMNKEDYFYDSSEAQDGSVCMLRIMANSENFNIFGTPLMQGYYVVFDADNHRIGFGPSSNSDKPTPVTGS